MDIGVIVPQGITGEYDGWQAAAAWARTVHVAQQAERLGFESIWLFDHLHTVPDPTDELTFESFTTLAALAALTSRVRLGHVVLCTLVSQSGTHGQDDRHARCHQRRPCRAGSRRGMERG